MNLLILDRFTFQYGYTLIEEVTNVNTLFNNLHSNMVLL